MRHKLAGMLAALFLVAAWQGATLAARLHPESWYQRLWCRKQGGQLEARLPDDTRCDCLTATHAVEFDFGSKWAEAIGQALYYSLQTGKRAGIVLILEKETDYKYWLRLNTTIQHFQLPIDTWIMTPENP